MGRESESPDFCDVFHYNDPKNKALHRNDFGIKWNVMSLITRGSIFSCLQHLIAHALDLMPCLQAQSPRDCNKGIKFKKGAINCCFSMGLINKMKSRREV